jgi:hypothetical protein
MKAFSKFPNDLDAVPPYSCALLSYILLTSLFGVFALYLFDNGSLHWLAGVLSSLHSGNDIGYPGSRVIFSRLLI